MSRDLALELRSVSARYGQLTALQPIDLAVPRGGLAVIVGPNGAGKSTLLRTIAGLVRASGGTIALDGERVSGRSAHSRARSGVIMVPESRGALPGLSVEENLKLGARLARSRGGDGLVDWAAVARRFPRLAERAWQDCSSLSGGEMQMLAIARAVAGRPTVLLLDEPSRGLSPLLVGEVYDALAGLNRDGLAMILVEQKAVPLWRRPDETIVLSASRVIHRVSGETVSAEELARLYMGVEEATAA